MFTRVLRNLRYPITKSSALFRGSKVDLNFVNYFWLIPSQYMRSTYFKEYCSRFSLPWDRQNFLEWSFHKRACQTNSIRYWPVTNMNPPDQTPFDFVNEVWLLRFIQTGFLELSIFDFKSNGPRISWKGDLRQFTCLPILPGANFDQLVKLCETVCEQVKQVTLLGKGLESLLIIFKLRQNQKIGSRTPI